MEKSFVEYIATKNAEIQAYMDENPGCWMTFLVTDEEFWAERGISTIAQYERDADETCLYEICKDLGWRRTDIKNLSDEQLAKDLKTCSEMLSREIEAQQEGQRINVEKFETRIRETIDLGASGRETAIKWIAEAEGITGDEWEYRGCETLEYTLNLPYGYIKRSLGE